MHFESFYSAKTTFFTFSRICQTAWSWMDKFCNASVLQLVFSKRISFEVNFLKMSDLENSFLQIIGFWFKNLKRSKFWFQKFFKVSELELANFGSWDVQLQSAFSTSTFDNIHLQTTIENHRLLYLPQVWQNIRRSNSFLCTNLQKDFSLWLRSGVRLFSVWIRNMQKPAATESISDSGNRTALVSRMSA